MLREKELRWAALKHLAGVGDREQEWKEVASYAYHVRRRLTPKEQERVGEALDCRGTEEGIYRFQRIRSQLPSAGVLFVLRELGLVEEKR